MIVMSSQFKLEKYVPNFHYPVSLEYYTNKTHKNTRNRTSDIDKLSI